MFTLKTFMGKPWSLASVNAVASITLRFFDIASSKDNESKNLASLFISGSESKTPSTLVALSIRFACVSIALKHPAVSVVKKGLPVPAVNITT